MEGKDLEQLNIDFDAFKKRISEDGGDFGRIFSELDGIYPEDGMTIMAMVLVLDDEKFETVAPSLLNEFTREMEDTNSIHQMFLDLQTSGSSPDEFVKGIQRSMLELDKMDDSIFSQKKKEFLKSILGIMSNRLMSYQEANSIKVFVDIERMSEDVKLPVYAHIGDAGLDIFANEEIIVDPGQTILIKTGIKIALPAGYEVQVRDKSGVALKTKLRVANAPGTIDSNYREEIGVILENIDPKIKEMDIVEEFDNEGNPTGYSIKSILYGKSFIIEKGQKIAQLVLNRVPTIVWNEVEDISRLEDNRTGGFGSTGLF